MTRILLLGRTGQVGWELNRSLQPLGDVVAFSRSDADFSHPESLRGIVKEAEADIIVNAAAYTAVDKAEVEESLANIINADAPAILAEEAVARNALLVHYSTDYVFGGEKVEAYIEGDAPNPINAYGRTKLAGEKNIQASRCRHLIFRTSWVYSSRGQNFVKTILRLAQERSELKIVNDQIGAPTSARFIADVTSGILMKMRSANSPIAREVGGIYHLTASQHTTWYGFAQTILAAAQHMPPQGKSPITLIPIPTEQYPLPAARPKNSRLNCAKLSTQFGIHLPTWETYLQFCLDDLAERNNTH